MPRKGDQVAGSDTQVAAFLFGLARGATVEGAAVAAGLKVATLYWRRKRCAVFARAWREALEAWDADGAGADGAEAAARKGADWAPAFGGPFAGERAEEPRGTTVRWHAGRGPMRKRKRPVEFDRERKQAFLDHFAETCNLEASAAAAGVSLSPVYRALKTDPAFADGFEDALKAGYLFLEAEAVRQQREAQRAYRIDPKGEAAAQSFERTMQLLREYKRPGAGIGRRAPRQGDARSRWTFEEAMAALETKLAHFGVEIVEEEEEEEPSADAGGPLPQPAPPGGPTPRSREDLEGDGDA